MWIALWMLGQLRKHSVGGRITVSAIEAKWSRASLLCLSLLSKSSLSGDITHSTFNSVKENIFTVGKHSRRLVTNVCPRPVLPCWFCVGRMGENNQLVLAGSATLMCGKLGILSLSIRIDYVCGSLCLWIDTIRLKRRGRKEGRRRSRRLREWVRVYVCDGRTWEGWGTLSSYCSFSDNIDRSAEYAGEPRNTWRIFSTLLLSSLSEIQG